MLRPYKRFGERTKLVRDTDTMILKGGRMNQIIFVLIGIVVSGLFVITLDALFSDGEEQSWRRRKL
jgi:hypothetical protein